VGQGALPDPTRTPGALNPMVTQETIGSTICVSGWTRYADRKLGDYEEDHPIPLVLGGSPSDARNLRVIRQALPREEQLWQALADVEPHQPTVDRATACTWARDLVLSCFVLWNIASIPWHR
jgi:hypothetical protein